MLMFGRNQHNTESNYPSLKNKCIYLKKKIASFQTYRVTQLQWELFEEEDIKGVPL